MASRLASSGCLWRGGEDALANAVTVARPIAEDIQDDQIVRARRQVSREFITIHKR